MLVVDCFCCCWNCFVVIVAVDVVIAVVCVLFVCLFVQYRSHTTVCLVLDCDLIVAEG